MPLNLYKKRGETPLECIQRYKKMYPRFRDVKMTYAGRLDPLGEGVLLVLYGNEIKNKNKYLSLDKKYEFKAIFGIETDSYDVLGKVISEKYKVKSIKEEKIRKELENFVGKRIQEYPPYSSKTVRGKSLFDWAKQGKLSQIEIPKKEVEIYSLTLLRGGMIPKRQFEKLVFDSISKVKGDFRQEEIKSGWVAFFQTSKQKKFFVARFSIFCGSGTYVRSLVYLLGKKLGTGATTLSIKRTDVGTFSLKNTER